MWHNSSDSFGDERGVAAVGFRNGLVWVNACDGLSACQTSAVSAPASLSVTAMASETSALISELRLGRAGYIPINGTRFNERQETGTGQLSPSHPIWSSSNALTCDDQIQ
jgi:hypothetical protein